MEDVIEIKIDVPIPPLEKERGEQLISNPSGSEILNPITNNSDPSSYKELVEKNTQNPNQYPF